jgi:hypothetical protein
VSWFSKKSEEDNSSAHVRTVRSTRGNRRVLRRERCDCAEGAARGGCTSYETPTEAADDD